MTLRFLTDYRSRAWMQRFRAGVVLETNNQALIDECLAAGVAEVVAPAPIPEPEPVLETHDDPIPPDDTV